MKYFVLFNPLSCNGQGKEKAFSIKKFLPQNDIEFLDMTEIFDYNSFFKKLSVSDVVVICGGDGTLNRFINSVDALPENDILYFATGSGNDFLKDLGFDVGCAPFSVKQYLMNLPAVTIKGRTYKFLNNVGFGIDGYCCMEGDRQRSLGKKTKNYTLIALKGLLYAFKPCNADVFVDGKHFKYKNVWLSPTMNGRYFGGGMMITPMQDRLNREKSVSLILAHNCNRFQLLSIFATVFKGAHIKYKKIVASHTGHEISVVFDRPSPLQIDGETITDVLEYKVKTAIKEKAINV